MDGSSPALFLSYRHPLTADRDASRVELPASWTEQPSQPEMTTSSQAFLSFVFDDELDGLGPPPAGRPDADPRTLSCKAVKTSRAHIY